MKRMTAQEWIAKIQARYPNVGYDYSLVTDVAGERTEVTLICPTHGAFTKRIGVIARQSGCPACGNAKKGRYHAPTIDGWLARFRAAHGDTYDYSQVTQPIKNRDAKITIRCTEHGEFEQAAGVHALGHGCPACGWSAAQSRNELGRDEFIKRFREAHGDRYDYSHLNEITCKDIIELHCPDHGPFRQRVQDHQYGKGCRQCGVTRGADVRRRTFDDFVRLANSVHAGAYTYDINTHGDEKLRIVCAKHGEFFQTAGKHLAGQGCPRCGSWRISYTEDEVFRFVQALCPDAEQSNRKLIAPKEIDIVVPSRRIAIELNGVYWHSDLRTTSQSAAQKHVAAAAAGYRLITIACEDWKRRRSQIESLLATALGASQLPKLNARDCEVREVPNREAVAFLDAHHPQTPAAIYAHRFGLYHPECGLVALMTFGLDVYRRNRTGAAVWDLSRFASSVHVRGGASKLFTAAQRALGFEHVVSYSANDWFAGGMYARLGFVKTAAVPADYRVFHAKLGFKPKSSWTRRQIPARLAQLGRADIAFDPATDSRTEWQIEDAVNALRVWDSGKIKWEWRK